MNKQKYFIDVTVSIVYSHKLYWLPPTSSAMFLTGKNSNEFAHDKYKMLKQMFKGSLVSFEERHIPLKSDYLTLKEFISKKIHDYIMQLRCYGLHDLLY